MSYTRHFNESMRESTIESNAVEHISGKQKGIVNENMYWYEMKNKMKFARIQ
jgi:hypothetical protein